MHNLLIDFHPGKYVIQDAGTCQGVGAENIKKDQVIKKAACKRSAELFHQPVCKKYGDGPGNQWCE